VAGENPYFSADLSVNRRFILKHETCEATKLPKSLKIIAIIKELTLEYLRETLFSYTNHYF
jgi:hypothetical protein